MLGASFSNTIIGSLTRNGRAAARGSPTLGCGRLSPETTAGIAASANIVIGVTSWGYIDDTVKTQGASPFTSSKIVDVSRAGVRLGAGGVSVTEVERGMAGEMHILARQFVKYSEYRL
jgi:hypothetical protein